METLPQPESPINKWFRAANRHRASAFYVDVGSVLFKVDGVKRLVPVDMRPVLQEDLLRSLSPILNKEKLDRLCQGEGIEFTYVLEGWGAWRVKVRNMEGQLSLSTHRLGDT
jgi:hypothetical protein